MDEGMTYMEKVNRVMFLREHRRNLLTAFCREDTDEREKQMLTQELKNVKNGVKARGMHTDTTAR